MPEPAAVTRAFAHAKATIDAIQIGGTPPAIPEDFSFEEVRLVRVALWTYAQKSGVPIPELPPEIAETIEEALSRVTQGGNSVPFG